MELARRVHISSSWVASEDISAVLYILSSSGSLLDEPLPAGRRATPISLTALSSNPDQPCRLQIDLSDLRGYIATQIELTTSSRTTELYCDEDDEYIGTVRGTVAGSHDSNDGVRKMYSCSHVLPSDTPHQKFNIKLLSLRGRSEVLVDKIQLVATEDHGGSAAAPQQRQRANGVDVQQLLGSLPVGNMPPFMQTLVSSLVHLTTPVGSGQAAAVDDGDRADKPPELSQLMETLRQMRPPPPPPVEVSTAASSTGEAGENDRVLENGRETPGHPDGGTSGVWEDTRELEERLKRYIDEKFEQLERRLEERLEELLISHLKTANSQQSTARES